MPFIDGPTLAEQVRESAGLSPRIAAEYARQLADALAAIHAAGFVHRDVKPGNVLIDRADGRVKLTDFGLVRSHAADPGVTTQDGMAGTPAYLSPEQVSRPDAVDDRSDLYSLGVTFYECLTGVPPFRGSTLDLLRLIAEQEPVPPGRLNRDVPADLQTICLKCLAKSPARRYQSAVELREDLDRFLAGKAIRARPVGSLERFARWCRRSPRMAGVTAALALTLTAGVTTSLVLWRRAETHAAQEQRQREAAERNLNATLEVIDRFFVQVSEEELLKVPGVEPVRKKLLTDAVAYYRRFVAERGDTPADRRHVAAAQDRLSALLLQLGETDEAVSAGRVALSIRERLAAEGPTTAARHEAADSLLQLARCLSVTPKPREAVAPAVAAAGLFADLKEATGDRRFARKEAEARIVSGTARMRANGIDHPDEFAAAIRLLEPVVTADLADAEAKRLLADALSSNATSRMAVADTPTLERVRQFRQELVTAAPDSLPRRFDLAQTHLNLGVLYKWGNRMPEATASYRAAATELDQLVFESPKVVNWRRNLARTRYNLGTLLRDTGHPADALSEIRSACEHFDRLTLSLPPDSGLLLESTSALVRHASLSLATGDRPAATAILDRLPQGLEKLHSISGFTGLQNVRLTEHVVAEAARSWLAAGDPTEARKLADAHAAYLTRCDPQSVPPEVRAATYRLRADVAAANRDATALLDVVKDWAAAFPENANQLAEAGRACAVAADPKSPTDPFGPRAAALFRQATAKGWKAPDDWRANPKFAPFLP